MFMFWDKKKEERLQRLEQFEQGVNSVIEGYFKKQGVKLDAHFMNCATDSFLQFAEDINTRFAEMYDSFKAYQEELNRRDEEIAQLKLLIRNKDDQLEESANEKVLLKGIVKSQEAELKSYNNSKSNGKKKEHRNG